MGYSCFLCTAVARTAFFLPRPCPTEVWVLQRAGPSKLPCLALTVRFGAASFAKHQSTYRTSTRPRRLFRCLAQSHARLTLVSRMIDSAVASSVILARDAVAYPMQGLPAALAAPKGAFDRVGIARTHVVIAIGTRRAFSTRRPRSAAFTLHPTLCSTGPHSSFDQA